MLVYAIGGSGSKKLCLAYLKDLHEGSRGFFLNVKIQWRSEVIAFLLHIKNSEIQIVSIHVRGLWCIFEQNWIKIATPDTFCIKCYKFQIFRIFL